jgi:hypothetical protein
LSPRLKAPAPCSRFWREIVVYAPYLLGQSVPWLSGRARACVNLRGSRARAHARLKPRRSPKPKFHHRPAPFVFSSLRQPSQLFFAERDASLCLPSYSQEDPVVGVPSRPQKCGWLGLRATRSSQGAPARERESCFEKKAVPNYLKVPIICQGIPGRRWFSLCVSNLSLTC